MSELTRIDARTAEGAIDQLLADVEELKNRMQRTMRIIKETDESEITLNFRINKLIDSWYDGHGLINKHIKF